MITRATVVRVVLFFLITLVLVGFVAERYFGALDFLPPRGYSVQLPLSNANGLFERNEVTYRGVKIGKVGPVQLTRDAVMAELDIEGGNPPIPADLRVMVADRSAVGEKYVDLLPNTDHGPYLKDGDVIPANRVSTPIPVQTVLLNLDQLVASVPLKDLRTVVRELGIGFDQLGPKLQLLLDSTNSLVKSAQGSLPQTIALIHDARTVLQTQNDLADPIKSFSSSVKKVTQQLKDSDPDIRRLTRTGPEAGREVSALLDEARPGLDDTIRQLLTLSHITRNHVRDIQSVLQLYTGLVAGIPTVVPGDGTAHLGVVLNVNDPRPCTNGYEATDQRPGTDTTQAHPTNYRAFCFAPIFSPILPRGFKPQYPFKDGKPQPPPPWFLAFYGRDTDTGVFRPSGSHVGDNNGRDARFQGRDDHDRRRARPASSRSGSGLPGLLGAPDTFGSFGLTPSLLSANP